MGAPAAGEGGWAAGPIPSLPVAIRDIVKRKQGQGDVEPLGFGPSSASGSLRAVGQVSSLLWASVSSLVKQELGDLSPLWP